MRDRPTLRWARRLQLAAIKGGENELLPFLILLPLCLAPPEAEGLGPDYSQDFLDGRLQDGYIDE